MGGSHANGTNLQITNSATDGDAVVQFALGGTVQYSMGVEDGDSDKFVINYGTGALGAQPALEIQLGRSGNSTGRFNSFRHIDRRGFSGLCPSNGRCFVI
jgi:hypothetical protein